MMKLMIMNAGISKGFRGVIFPDRSFVFVPLYARNWDCNRLPIYDDLDISDYSYSECLSAAGLEDASLAELLPDLQGVPVHNDPDFNEFVYGHVKRGFGYETLLETLDEGDILLFLATLDYRPIPNEKPDRTINKSWGGYLIGAFEMQRSPLSHADLVNANLEHRVSSNSHYYCKRYPYLWIIGKQNRIGLFKKAVPLSKPNVSKIPTDFLPNYFKTAGGKAAGAHGWYRHALICKRRTEAAWREIRNMAY